MPVEAVSLNGFPKWTNKSKAKKNHGASTVVEGTLRRRRCLPNLYIKLTQEQEASLVILVLHYHC